MVVKIHRNSHYRNKIGGVSDFVYRACQKPLFKSEDLSVEERLTIDYRKPTVRSGVWYISLGQNQKAFWLFEKEGIPNGA